MGKSNKILYFFIAVLFTFLSYLAIYSQNPELPSLKNIEHSNSIEKKTIDNFLVYTANLSKSNREESLKYLEKIKNKAIRVKYGKAIVNYAEQRSEISLNSTDFKSTYKELQNLYANHAYLLNNQEKSSFLIVLSTLASNLNFTDASMNFLNQALLSYNMEPNLSAIRANRGIVLQSQGKFGRASIDYFLALKYFEANNLLEDQAKVNNNLGRLFTSVKDFKRALFYYNKALTISEQLKNNSNIAIFNTNVGTAYQSLDSNSEGLTYYSNYLNLGSLYNKTPEVHKSLIPNDIAIHYAKARNISKEQINIYSNITDTYYAIGNYKMAYQSLKRKEELENEFLTKDNKIETELLPERHDASLKEGILAMKDLEIAKANERFRFILVLVILLIVIGFVTVVFLSSRNKRLMFLYERNIELSKLSDNETIWSDSTFIGVDKDSKLLTVFEQINRILTEEKLYRDPDLSISMLSERLNSNDKYISTAINQFTGVNFNSFVNTYRVNEVKSLIIQQGEQLNLNEVMYVSGFINRSTFYKVFIRHTGMSPKHFRSMVLNREQSELRVSLN